MELARLPVATLTSTLIKHYVRGPPQPSWGLKFHLIFKLIQATMAKDDLTVEFFQGSTPTARIPAGVTISESKIGNKYRHEAQIHLDRILKPFEHVLDDEWKDLKDDGIPFELVQVPDDGWERRKVRKTILYVHGGAYICGGRATHREITSTFAKGANARVFVIEYRLAPQNQFPAALQDALAAYLYLLDPPRDAGFDPLKPENIIIVGDSAGGGLSLGLGLAIRDAGLPSCAGIVGLSPWVDFTTSTPSHWDDKCDLTDLIPRTVHYESSQALTDYKKRATALTKRIKNQDPGLKFWHDSFDKPDENINLYISNQGLAIPYASPMLAESLGNLPPLFLVAGDVERCRDQIVYLAHKAAEPTKYKGPSYNAGKFEKSPFQNPTNTTLEVYEEMPHGFHIFIGLHPCVEISYKRIMEFTDRVMNTSETLPPSSYHSISSEEIHPLNEQQKEILKCDTIGIVPKVLHTYSLHVDRKSVK